VARVPLSKSQLTREKESLASYRRYLPALDLKRQQLMGERNRARHEIARLDAAVAKSAADAGEAIPMLADERVDVAGLAWPGEVRLGTQNVAGVKLPIVRSVEVHRAAYSRLVRPHWVDAVADRLAEAIRLRIEAEIARERLGLLEAAVVKITQRVNLFEKVLVPQTLDNIRRINVFLGDAERSAVVGAKIAKRKREEPVQQ
jgi:V/A-type H+/Na+-transporting ATPase subunit D